MENQKFDIHSMKKKMSVDDWLKYKYPGKQVEYWDDGFFTPCLITLTKPVTFFEDMTDDEGLRSGMSLILSAWIMTLILSDFLIERQLKAASFYLLRIIKVYILIN